MGQLRIELPDELHRKLRIKAAAEGVTLKELVIERLTEAIEEDEK